MKKYNLINKFRTFFIYMLPRDKSRTGECRRCGACCKFMFNCPFLKYVREKAECRIYPLRWWACRKYPLNEKEHLTKDICGFRF